MAIRIPRGYDVNRPYYNELCEGQRPVDGAAAREAWTGLAYTRIDEVHHDPIVLEPGTIVGMITGGNALGAGKLVPAMMGTGMNDNGLLYQDGESNTWGLPAASGQHSIGRVRPIGVCYQPIYSFILQSRYTNYTRNTAVGIVTDYVIQVPAINGEEWLIESGDVVCLGSGKHHGSGAASTHAAAGYLAGRYARYTDFAAQSDAHNRVVGRCLRKIKLGTGGSSTSAGDKLADKLTDFTINSAMTTEFANLAKIQTVPGLNLTGSGTKGIPGYWLGARADANKDYWGLTLLIRL